MKRTMLAGAALLGVLSYAAAADFGAPPVFDPPAEEPRDWGGLFLGGHVGYGWANRDGTYGDGDDGDFEFDYDQEGWLGGAQIGYNYALGHNFLLGVAVDGSLASIEGTLVDDDDDSDLGDGQWTWLSTATARIGVGWHNFMIYGEGGLALAGFDFEGPACDFDQNRDGWVAGGGAEVKVSQRASLFGEYNYLDFGSEDQDCGDGIIAVLGGGDTHDVDADMHVVKFGFNYLLGPQ